MFNLENIRTEDLNDVSRNHPNPEPALRDRRFDVVQVDGIGHPFDFAWNTPEPVNLYPHPASDKLLNLHTSFPSWFPERS
jgi:hypothetical protein